MSEANPAFTNDAALVAPDGDAQIAERFHADFRIPACPSCGGMLKPDVVFFGDSVPKDRVKAAWTPSLRPVAWWLSDLP